MGNIEGSKDVYRPTYIEKRCLQNEVHGAELFLYTFLLNNVQENLLPRIKR